MSYILDTPMPNISVFLRSSDASSGNLISSKNDLIFELNQPILSYPNTDLLVSLQSFSYTNSFYTVNENNCKFNYTYNNSYIHSMSISYGNYTIDELIAHLNEIFNNIFVFSYSINTLKITITNLINPFRLVTLENENNNIYEMLGFDDYINYTTFANSYTSPYVFNMMSVQQIHVCVPNLNLSSIGLKNRTKYSIINTIQVTASPGETQHYENNNNFKYKISDNAISSISIILLNQDFQSIDFNNIDYFLNITFSYIYTIPFLNPDYLISNDNTARVAVLNKEKIDLLNEQEI
jgi:hypothetical protein